MKSQKKQQKKDGRSKTEKTSDKRSWYRTVYLKSEHWSSLRARALERNSKCEACGRSGRREPHHMAYRQIYNVLVDDLVVLCRRCHKIAHEIIDRGIIANPVKLSEGIPQSKQLLLRCISFKLSLPFKSMASAPIRVPMPSVRGIDFLEVMHRLGISREECDYVVRLFLLAWGGKSLGVFKKRATTIEMANLLRPSLIMAKYRNFSHPISDSLIDQSTSCLIATILDRPERTRISVRPIIPASTLPNEPEIKPEKTPKDYNSIKTQLAITEDQLTAKFCTLKSVLGDGFKLFKRTSTEAEMADALRGI